VSIPGMVYEQAMQVRGMSVSGKGAGRIRAPWN
jgi:hypothetical protein